MPPLFMFQIIPRTQTFNTYQLIVCEIKQVYLKESFPIFVCCCLNYYVFVESLSESISHFHLFFPKVS